MHSIDIEKSTVEAVKIYIIHHTTGTVIPLLIWVLSPAPHTVPLAYKDPGENTEHIKYGPPPPQKRRENNWLWYCVIKEAFLFYVNRFILY